MDDVVSREFFYEIEQFECIFDGGAGGSVVKDAPHILAADQLISDPPGKARQEAAFVG